MTPQLRVCAIDARQPNKTIGVGHLRLGGTDPSGNRLDVTNRYLTWNGRPYYVISGEFHYSRYPQAGWEDELLKLKAGGINTVATYVFWIYHEERQGEFEWDGQKNLRRFVELCARHGLKVILRIGPFAHGEWRNGGLPDWLYGQPFDVRSNDPTYLAHVERLYVEIGKQVEGLLFADGGPIIGLQLENEYMHAGAPWEVVDPVRDTEWVSAGHEGVEHLKALKELAHRAGLDTPIYLVTAWGAPIIEDETLPVYGGYAYPVWVDDPGPSALYTFRDGQASSADGPLDPDRYPLIYAEMQGGIQVRYHNRPVVPPRSVEALALVCIGKGSNWLGYYMYHGGTTPPGRHGFSHERLHPQLSYDFQSPLGEFGEYHASYHYLRLLHHFLEAFGESLGPMGAILPANADAIEPGNLADIRYCIRARDGSGFLFVNNFQDHLATHDLADVVFEVNSAQGAVRIPHAGGLTIRAESCFILPFHQMLADAHLLSATAQPLTFLTDGQVALYFYFVPLGLEAEFCFAADTISRVTGALEQQAVADRLVIKPAVGKAHRLEIETAAGNRLQITTLTRAEAEQTWKGKAWDKERVIVSSADLIFVDKQIEARTSAPVWNMTLWPPLDRRVAIPGATCEQADDSGRTAVRVSRPPTSWPLDVRQVSPRKFVLRLPDTIPPELSEVFLRVEYDGNTGMAFINGRLVADNFNNGAPWVIGLRRFWPELAAGELCLVFSPWRKGAIKNTSSRLAGRSEFEGEEALTVKAITAMPEYRICFDLDGQG